MNKTVNNKCYSVVHTGNYIHEVVFSSLSNQKQLSKKDIYCPKRITNLSVFHRLNLLSQTNEFQRHFNVTITDHFVHNFLRTQYKFLYNKKKPLYKQNSNFICTEMILSILKYINVYKFEFSNFQFSTLYI